MAQTTYLKRVQLSGYKTVRNVDVEFKPGLNIIIGYNGVGKTNFMRMLYDANNIDLWESNEDSGDEQSATMTFVSSDDYHKIKLLRHKYTDTAGLEFLRLFKRKKKFNYKYYFNDVAVENNYDLLNKCIERGIIFDVHLLEHYFYDNLEVLEDSIKLQFISQRGIIRNLRYPESSSNMFYGVLQNILFFLEHHSGNLSQSDLKKYVNELFIKISRSLTNPLTDLKLLDRVVYTPERLTESDKPDEELYSLGNLFFTYEVNGSPLTFEDLSDGVKRLVYIFSSLIPELRLKKDNATLFPRLILLEEPELGIHPHLLHQLLTKLREVSEEAQVIITTHSPQVLDILGVDELDRIIIADYHPKEGTVLRHLTDEQIEQARDYIIETDSLSGYWIRTHRLQNPHTYEPHTA